jgi:uncharacterized Zn-binding protein involved in type VI secretion
MRSPGKIRKAVTSVNNRAAVYLIEKRFRAECTFNFAQFLYFAYAAPRCQIQNNRMPNITMGSFFYHKLLKIFKMGQPAARVGDMHVCPMVTPGLPPIPHVGGPITGPGCPTVLIGGTPASIVGDMCVCVGPPDSIVMGSTTVLIGGMPAVRMGDTTAHGGSIVLGLPTVLIG